MFKHYTVNHKQIKNMKQYLYRLWQWVWKGIPVQKINAGITTIEHGQTLDGHKILITGGSRGIGYMLAKRFIAEGALVAMRMHCRKLWLSWGARVWLVM